MNDHERELMSCRLGQIRNVRRIVMTDGAGGWRRIKLGAKLNRLSSVAGLDNRQSKSPEKPAITIQ